MSIPIDISNLHGDMKIQCGYGTYPLEEDISMGPTTDISSSRGRYGYGPFCVWPEAMKSAVLGVRQT